MAEKVVSYPTTLVKYDNPVLVTRHPEKKPTSEAWEGKSASGILSPTQPAGRAKSAVAQSAQSVKETEEILNAILPPRECEENGQLWRQQVSSTPATRLDVINLQEQLDMLLQQRQARESGICPVRRELYSQCFDELIRQVTINCAERGLLLLRVRDDINMTIAAYQTLYESSIAFGMRKALMAEQSKGDLEELVQTLKSEKRELEKQVIELRQKAEQVERRSKEMQQAEEKKHTEEVEFLRKTNQQLKAQLESAIAPKRKR
ncbi:33 kDa inner dynein arm light chain, axonemal isoform X1 [Schistocerca gregaria]|uniref:33 kDa inner dynein arm light chain, axonemal isoform X1 n=1 Tax=Schistocerca gregaria TaxID=7010 RepID=UPI00211E3E5E|nr:33 kDa inner dynein arm light chain, axonemal isoform X1 [Schistocerca gregaria]